MKVPKGLFVTFFSHWADWLPLAAGVAFFGLVFTFLPRKAAAAEVVQKAHCGGSAFSKKLLQAQFKWNGSTPSQLGQTLRLTVGEAAGKGFAEAPVAQIWSEKGECQAVCESMGLERDESGKPSFLKLNCRSPQLKLLSVPVTVFWPAYGSVSQRDPMVIRFGSWLNGFEQASLSVSLDRFGDSLGGRPSISEIALATPHAER